MQQPALEIRVASRLGTVGYGGHDVGMGARLVVPREQLEVVVDLLGEQQSKAERAC